MKKITSTLLMLVIMLFTINVKASDLADIHTEIYPMHKVGGYPAYIQPGRWDDDYEFIFQISSDDKAGLNIVDSGSFYFFYSKKLDKWDVQCDFC